MVNLVKRETSFDLKIILNSYFSEFPRISTNFTNLKISSSTKPHQSVAIQTNPNVFMVTNLLLNKTFFSDGPLSLIGATWAEFTSSLRIFFCLSSNFVQLISFTNNRRLPFRQIILFRFHEIFLHQKREFPNKNKTRVIFTLIAAYSPSPTPPHKILIEISKGAM